jgi:uncharacterized membrane protein required for colicin V production
MELYRQLLNSVPRISEQQFLVFVSSVIMTYFLYQTVAKLFRVSRERTDSTIMFADMIYFSLLLIVCFNVLQYVTNHFL